MASNYAAGDQPAPGIRLEKFLGRGGFGQVWQATAPGGTAVAVKIVDLVCSQGAKESRAMRLVKGLRHPHIVSITAMWLKDEEGNVYDAASDDSTTQTMLASAVHGRARELIVVMGLGDMSLHDRLNECLLAGKGGIPAKELLGYMDDAARAIDFLGSRRHTVDGSLTAFQHCDIKPQNILLVGGVAQLCDLGLARLLDDTRATRPAVSPAYGSPECLAGAPPSSATDQYSLAVSYVELRTGKLPFAEGATPSLVIHAHVTGQLELGHLPPAEQAVVRRATDRDPCKRYGSATEFVQAIREAALGNSQLTEAWSGALLQQSAGWPVRRTKRRLAACIVAVLACGGAITAWRSENIRQYIDERWHASCPQHHNDPPAAESAVRQQLSSPVATGFVYDQSAASAVEAANAAIVNAKSVAPENSQAVEFADHSTSSAANAETSESEPAEPLGLARLFDRVGVVLVEDARGQINAWQNLAATIRPSDWRDIYVAGLISDANLQLENGDAAAAVCALGKVLPWVDAKDQVELRWRRGLQLAELGDARSAIADYGFVISQDPRRTSAYYERGRLSAELATAASDPTAAQSQRLAAIADFTTVLQLESTSADARYSRASVLAALDRMSEAMADLDVLVKESPRHAEAFALRAALFAHDGKLNEAIADCTQALAIDSDNVNAAALRGRAYALSADWTSAADDYAWVLAHDADRADIRRLHAIALAKLAKLDEALAELDVLVRSGQSDSVVWRLKALVHMAEGQFDQALAAREEFQKVSGGARLVLPLVAKSAAVQLTKDDGQGVSLRVNERMHLERSQAGRLTVQLASGRAQGSVASDAVRSAVDF